MTAEQPTNQTQTCPVAQKAKFERVHRHVSESQLTEPEQHLTAAGRKEKLSKANERPAAGSILYYQQCLKPQTSLGSSEQKHKNSSLLRRRRDRRGRRKTQQNKNRKTEHKISDGRVFTEDNELERSPFEATKAAANDTEQPAIWESRM